MMLRKIYALQLSYDVSDEEKRQAEKALLCFDHAIGLLDTAVEHLEIMGVPFKDHPDIKPNEIVKYRAALRRFRDKMIENFNNFKRASEACRDSMQMFLSDTEILKLIRLFSSSIEEVEAKVNDMASLFNNLEAQNFVQQINTKIDEVVKLCKELEDTIHDRIEEHIKNNIIGKNWIKEIDRKQTPIQMELLKQRQEKLHNSKKNKSS